MDYILDELKVNKIIDKFDWKDLSCYEKSTCLMAESLKPNSLFYHLLFGELREGGFLKGNYTNFLEDKTKIKFVLEFSNGNNFSNDLLNNITNKNYIILLINIFYLKESFWFNKRHHPHFVILKGYDSNSKRYIVIDEDLSKNYAYTANFANGVEYVDMFFEKDYFEKLCCTVNEIDESQGIDAAALGLGTSFYSYLKVQDSCKEMPFCDLNDIINTYENLLTELIDASLNYEEALKESILCFKTNLHEYYDEFSSLKSSLNPVFQDDFLVYPKQTKIIGIHNYSLNTQRKLFDLLLKESNCKQDLMQLFDICLKNYLNIKNVISKSIISGNKNTCDKAIKFLTDTSSNEIKLYRLILQSLRNSILDGFRSIHTHLL